MNSYYFSNYSSSGNHIFQDSPYLTLFNDLAEESGKVKRITSKEMDVFHRLSIYVITVVNKTM